MSLHLKTCLIASTHNNISQGNNVPILTVSSNLGAATTTSNHPYHPKFSYFIILTKVNPCLTDVSDHSKPSITITTKYSPIPNMLEGILETHNTATIPNTTVYKFKQPIHHHLSYRHYIRDQRIVHIHQSTYLFIPNAYSIDQNSHSQFINLFVTSLHL